MGVSGECAVKGAGSKSSQPCHCCGSQVSSLVPSLSNNLHPTNHHINQQQQHMQQQRNQHQLNQQQHHQHQNTQGKHSVENGHNQNTADNNILAPLRIKMKVLKKLKRRMGLGEFDDFLFSRKRSQENTHFLPFSFLAFRSPILQLPTMAIRS